MVDMNESPPKQTQKGKNDDVHSGSSLKKSEEKSHGTIVSRLDKRLNNFLFTEISIAPLVYYRIIFGGIMLYEVCNYFNSGWIPYYYINPKIYFKYFGWEWMPGPLPGKLMYLFYVAMAVIYFCFIIGLWYRVISIAAFLGFFYWFNLVS
jgi:vitamin K-dependent gamma-carboxylase